MLPILLFINDKPSNIKNILANKNCIVSKFSDSDSNIYQICIDKEPINWLIKVYNDEKYAKREANILSELESIEGIPRLFAFGTSSLFSYIILSKIEGKELFRYKGKLNEDDLKNVSRQLLTILKKVHSKNIVHRDIKPENIIYNENTKKVSLIDFEQKTTDGFECPEFFDNKKNSDPKTKWDIWSFGITIYETYFKVIPFKNTNEILNNTLTFKSKISDDFSSFLECALEKDENKRYSAIQLLNHAWLIK